MNIMIENNESFHMNFLLNNENLERKTPPKDMSMNNIKKKSIKKKQTKPKVKDEDFKPLQYNEFENINNYNYSLSQLKSLCKNYKLKVTGNKSKLSMRIYDHLKNTFYITKIQSTLRGKIVRNYIKLHGPGFINKKDCVNETDFYSLDDLTEIPHYQYYSFKDSDGFVYGFDICSLYNYIKTQGNAVKNPYNRNPFPDNLVVNIRRYIKYCRILKFPLELEIETLVQELTPAQKLQSEIVTLFSRMDELGFYTDSAWFSSLDRGQLLKFIREIMDIWVYRANLTPQTKYNIYPHHGLNPFYGIQLTNSGNQTTFSIKKMAVKIISRFISHGTDNSSKWLGASYCLSALTLVNQNAAQALPWLYESVLY